MSFCIYKGSWVLWSEKNSSAPLKSCQEIRVKFVIFLRQDVPEENIGNLDILNEDDDNDELQNLLLPLLGVNILPNVD